MTAAPATLDDRQASTLRAAGLTAWFSLIEMGLLVGGRACSIPVQASSQSFACAAIAVADGAEVVVTSSSDAKFRRAKALGAAHGINRNANKFVRAVDLIGLKPVIDRRYPFGELQAALKRRKSGAFGKIAIDMFASGDDQCP